jgi:hypothetical protein
VMKAMLKPTDSTPAKIAQRLNAWALKACEYEVPPGTKEQFYHRRWGSTSPWPRYPALKRWAIFISIPSGSVIAAQNFHEIAPPVDYSFFPTWLIFVASFVALSLVGLIVWWLKRNRKSALPPKLPREIALEELERVRAEIETMNPYQFSIRVSDILRRYVTNQYALPVTRQTSVEFLTALAKSSPFSTNEKSLLEDFLNRCDLIKFARYEATSEDSHLLLEEATRFVKGEQLAIA